MIFSTTIHIPLLQKEYIVDFPSQDISFLDAKSIVCNVLKDEHPNGELYISIDGKLILPNSSSLLSNYNLKAPFTNLVYKNNMKKLSICITKEFLIDLNTPIHILLEELKHQYIINDKSTINTFIAREGNAEITINDLQNIRNPSGNPNNNKLIPVFETKKIRDNNNIVYLIDESIPHVVQPKISKSPRRSIRSVESPKKARTPRKTIRSIQISDEISHKLQSSNIDNIPTLNTNLVLPSPTIISGSKTEREKKRTRLQSFIRTTRNKSTMALPIHKMKSSSDDALSSFNNMPIDINIDNHDKMYFGVSLETICKRDNRLVPCIVEKMIDSLDRQEGYKVEGIFRICGNQDDINTLVNNFENGISFNLDDYKSHVIANCLKYFIQLLPEPILTFQLHKRFITALSIGNVQLKIDYFRTLISSLPESHQIICKLLVNYMNKVIQNKDTSKMDSNSLGIILGPLLWRPRDNCPDYFANFLEYSKYTAKIGKIILKHFNDIFCPCSPILCIRTGKSYKIDKIIIDNDIPMLSIQEDKFVYIFKQTDEYWYAECNKEIGIVDKSFIMDSIHILLDLTKHEITLEILNQLDPDDINALKSPCNKQSTASTILSPRILFGRK